MHKASLWNELLKVRLSTLVLCCLCITSIVIFFIYYGEYNYTQIPPELIENELYKALNPNLVLKKDKFDCDYESLLKSTKYLDTRLIPKKFDDFSALGLVNGSYVPEHCNPIFSVAILITYRNRQSQLDILLPYIHNFLRKQNIHYKIYLIEQQDEKPWNKGLLYNIGAKQAIADKFPCLILQDVDLLPLDFSNLYVCLKQPRHMSASIDKFRFVLPYNTLVGGVMAIRADQYVAVNGFSNRFQGWGGEDDDFAARLHSRNFNIIRFPPSMARYSMLVHRQEPRNSERLRIMAENPLYFGEEGYNSMRYESVAVKENRLMTVVGARL